MLTWPIRKGTSSGCGRTLRRRRQLKTPGREASRPVTGGLPTGTVTFLFTDIEGSTKAVQRLGSDHYEEVLHRHARIIRGALADVGHEISTEGDSFFAVFQSPVDAVRAAVQAQRSLASERWPEEAPIRVRMGLHTGEGRLGGDNYIGVDVNRAARVAAAAHGGQVIISEATRALTERELPSGVALRDLGAHRLKDLVEPERLYQLSIEDLPSEFPPPKTLDARPNNLPLQLTRFVGRRDEIAAVAKLMEEGRLLTLTGPGGTGKTRLAVEVGAQTLTRYENGAFFVDLSPITDPTLVASVIAERVGVMEQADRPLDETLKDHLKDKDVLLILDNFEQVAPAASLVQALLEAAPRLRVLATSRVRLGLYGESEFPVPPLDLPDAADLQDVESLSRFESVALFVDRAVAAKPTFQLTGQNMRTVAEVAARLDGLPLAIELAASRIKVLSADEILKRLDQRLRLIAGSDRDRPERQRTLRGAIEWSYDLLKEAERKPFARLSVFPGGCSIEGAEVVCNPDGELGGHTVDILAALIDKSLLLQTETPAGESRFSMLETIREYAAERLRDDFDAEATAHRFAEWIRSFAEQAEPHLEAEGQALWLDRCEEELDNIRTAIAWALALGEAEVGLRTAAAIWRFCQQRGHLREGRAWLEGLLGLPSARSERAAVGKANLAAGSIAYWQNDLEATTRHYEDAVSVYRELDDPPGLAFALWNLGILPMMTGDLARARALLSEARELARASNAEETAALADSYLAYTEFFAGNYEVALATASPAVETWRRLGNRWREADALAGVGQALRMLGRYDEARDAYRRSLSLFWEAKNLPQIAMILDMLAATAVAEGEIRRAARLAGAASAIKEEVGGGAPEEVIRVGDIHGAVHESLGDEGEALWTEGRGIGLSEAVAWAISQN